MGFAGLVTITSGKWTTYRKMAEVTVDLVCAKLGYNGRAAPTWKSYPAQKSHGHHSLGMRLEKIEKACGIW